MLRVRQVKIKVEDDSFDNLKLALAKKLHINTNHINNYKIGSQISSNNYALYNPNQNFINPSVNQNAITNVSKIITI